MVAVKYWPHLIVLGVRDDHTGDVLQLLSQVFFQLFQKNSSVVPGIEIVNKWCIHQNKQKFNGNYQVCALQIQ